ncbi:signal recognition particle-docking protein FtsY [Pseudomonas sp. PA27(2017)]|uniref:signal recognition particle-docking protein FtsY n=1 Tax=Pseudomonas sp. PA27(2017) TaxID=1932112 RepID=UPI000969F56A|nr:signal recognition particle-docking protein FtsY [Pseudomonas sp. PA27(2017)]OLU34633.1 signal recognition particle-docking protein FtsY [Pseudomonas sp. PA27(2017)]
MFGSKDDNKTPAPEQGAEKAEKRGLFGWLRKKPAEAAAAEPAQQAEVPEAAAQSQPEQPAEAAQVIESAPLENVPVERDPVERDPVERDPVNRDPVEAPVVSEPAVAAEPVVDDATRHGPEALLEPIAEQPAAPAEHPAALASGSDVQHAVPATPAAVLTVPAEAVAEPVVEQNKPSDNKGGWFARLRQGLSKTSASIGEGMASLFLGKKTIDDDLLDEIETRLLTADVGVEATTAIIGSLTQKVARKQLTDSDALFKALQEELAAMLRPVEQPLQIDSAKRPYVILVVGVNGAGKTTTIGKLAKKLQGEGKKVMLAAGDTFRAAAVEQLQVWGERNKIPVIAQHTGADSASVIFDAVQAAKSRGMDVLIADTAGRLHTKDNLMEELKKVRRVIGKLDDSAPHEVLLVLDAGTGQNAINQAKQFNQTVNLTGLALTKLDGTAKGGVIFALAKQFGLPIRYIGVGEGIDDLRTFEAEPFVQALFQQREQ